MSLVNNNNYYNIIHSLTKVRNTFEIDYKSKLRDI